MGAMTSGAETSDWSCAELHKMDAMICRKKAYDGTPRKGWTNEEVFRYWRVAPMKVEIAVGRTAWHHAISKAPQEHAQVTTAVWGTMLKCRRWTASAI